MDTVVDTPKGPGLKRRMLKAGGWIGVGQVASHVLRLGANLILTRLLVPEMFGIMSIVVIVGVVLTLLSDLGVGQSVVKSHRGNERDFLNTAWTVQILRGGVVYVGALLVALGVYMSNRLGWVPPHSTYAEPLLPALVAVASLTSLVTSFQSTNYFTAHRALDMKSRVQLELMVQIASLVVMLALAWWSRSIWAIVTGMVVGSVVHTLLTHYWLPGTLNRLQWEKPAVKELVGFGRWVLASSSISVFAMNGDRLLLGALVSADLLGMYSIAFALSGIVFSVIIAVVSLVSLPAFSELERTTPERVRPAYLQVRRYSDSAVIFFAGFLFFTAQPIVRMLYDDRYIEAGIVLQILSFSALFSRYMIAQQIYLALGKARYLVAMSAIQVISLYSIVPLGYKLYGFHGAVIAIALKDVFVVPLILYLNSRHNLNDFRFELLVLSAWPAGASVGWLVHTIGAILVGT